MYDYNQNNDNQVRWNGSTYSTGPYRMEDLRSTPPTPPASASTF